MGVSSCTQCYEIYLLCCDNILLFFTDMQYVIRYEYNSFSILLTDIWVTFFCLLYIRETFLSMFFGAYVCITSEEESLTHRLCICVIQLQQKLPKSFPKCLCQFLSPPQVYASSSCSIFFVKLATNNTFLKKGIYFFHLQTS